MTSIIAPLGAKQRLAVLQRAPVHMRKLLQQQIAQKDHLMTNVLFQMPIHQIHKHIRALSPPEASVRCDILSSLTVGSYIQPTFVIDITVAF